jgi:LysM repeat protein
MPNEAPYTSARLIAPVALVVCAIAFFAVIIASSGDGDGGQQPATERTATSKRSTGGERRGRPARTYTVRAGDTLAAIADRTGVPIERLQELNPELDPQALVSGQKIKLRE